MGDPSGPKLKPAKGMSRVFMERFGFLCWVSLLDWRLCRRRILGFEAQALLGHALWFFLLRMVVGHHNFRTCVPGFVLSY